MIDIDKQAEINLELWKYFTDDAAKIKDRMWTIASWMFSLQAGLLAFIATHFSADQVSLIQVNNEVMVLMTTGIGIVLCVYTLFMIQQYGQHVRGMWNRADQIRRQVPGLSEIWFLNKIDKIKEDSEKEGKEEQSLPSVAMRLIYLCIGFMMVFVALLCKAVF